MPLKTSNKSETSEIIESPDDRVPMLSDGFPWSTIGLIEAIDDKKLFKCTGTLIWPNLVLTAAHCVLNTLGKPKHPVKFCPNYKNATCYAASYGLGGTLGGTDYLTQMKNDWAIMIISEPLGYQYKWMGLEKIAFNKRDYSKEGIKSITSKLIPGFFGNLTSFRVASQNDNYYRTAQYIPANSNNVTNDSAKSVSAKVTLGGYSADFMRGETAGVDEICNITVEENNGTVRHDCAMKPGSSGGALFQSKKIGNQWGPYILAINIAETGGDILPSAKR